MWMRTLLLAAATSLMLGSPAVAGEKDTRCEDICAELAAANCKRINSVSCSFYIVGCLSGCAVGQIIATLTD